jgi:hypothetical protein
VKEIYFFLLFLLYYYLKIEKILHYEYVQKLIMLYKSVIEFDFGCVFPLSFALFMAD